MDRIESLREIVAGDPKDGLARFMLGKELLAADLPNEAAEQLAEAIRLAPDHTASYRELGNALASAGRLSEAEVAYSTGLKVADTTGDLQTAKEIKVFLARLKRRTC
jgi:Flp pilus assembly protein TadD